MPPALKRHADLSKTITYLGIHLTIGFGVAYLFTGSVAVAGGIALVEPMVNAVAFFIHEKVWKKAMNPPVQRLRESDCPMTQPLL